jgi:hypothetical protein
MIDLAVLTTTKATGLNLSISLAWLSVFLLCWYKFHSHTYLQIEIGSLHFLFIKAELEQGGGNDNLGANAQVS